MELELGLELELIESKRERERAMLLLWDEFAEQRGTVLGHLAWFDHHACRESHKWVHGVSVLGTPHVTGATVRC